jgi:hypothetical protein
MMKISPVSARTQVTATDFTINRRQTLRYALATLGMALGSPLLSGCSDSNNSNDFTEIRSLELQAPDENGIALPMGYTSRIVARSTEMVDGRWYVLCLA